MDGSIVFINDDNWRNRIMRMKHSREIHEGHGDIRFAGSPAKDASQILFVIGAELIAFQ